MIVPNLAVDHMAAHTPLARSADITAAMRGRKRDYVQVAKRMGLSVSDFSEFTGDTDLAIYGRLPSHIDEMAGRKPSGRVYVLHNLIIPAGTMGWSVKLADEVMIYIPASCGNLSLSWPRRHKVTMSAPFHNISYRGYFPPTPVVFVPTQSESAAGVDATPLALSSSPVGNPASGGFNAGWLAPVFPIIISIFSGGGGGSSWTPPGCSLGSNEWGVCTVGK